MEGFTILDGVVAAIIIISALLAYSRGFVREAMAIAPFGRRCVLPLPNCFVRTKHPDGRRQSLCKSIRTPDRSDRESRPRGRFGLDHNPI